MKVNMYSLKQMCSGVDVEWLNIIKRLQSYGKKSTGSKDKDKALLHSIELEKAEIDPVSNKFLTVTLGEREKIKNKKKEKRIENNPEAYPNSQKGAKILGEQIYLAIQMKNKKKK